MLQQVYMYMEEIIQSPHFCMTPLQATFLNNRIGVTALETTATGLHFATNGIGVHFHSNDTLGPKYHTYNAVRA